MVPAPSTIEARRSSRRGPLVFKCKGNGRSFFAPSARDHHPDPGHRARCGVRVWRPTRQPVSRPAALRSCTFSVGRCDAGRWRGWGCRVKMTANQSLKLSPGCARKIRVGSCFPRSLRRPEAPSRGESLIFVIFPPGRGLGGVATDVIQNTETRGCAAFNRYHIHQV